MSLNKIVLITGATSGIGKVAVKELVKKGGYKIILHGRNEEKLKTTVEEIKSEFENADLDTIKADLELLADVKHMVDEFNSKYDHLDVLVNNAGNQYGSQWDGTKEGHEKTMAVNTFAPFLLTFLLLKPLEKSGDARVVTVSSSGHSIGGQPFLDDIELKEHYGFIRAYGLSKLYVIWIMRHFIKYCEQNDIKNITFNCVHPGSTNTNLGKTNNRPLLIRFLNFIMIPVLLPIDKATWPAVYAVTSPELQGINNKYIGPKGEDKVDEKYYSEENEQKIWDYCMNICKSYIEN
ncbi:oxidoreductase [Anaeromyces robustus]|uniref:Oxidoreductase n=1 Tax=Anaeromyces robustus TaxID=1754192 RepID=A0A1Y1WU45_9FUNG|nr:oxidoreductase [Anaeromyces robustus]|eukprot:ORX77060.1 oxidoreductase [Anaeromyces robustus]